MSNTHRTATCSFLLASCRRGPVLLLELQCYPVNLSAQFLPATRTLASQRTIWVGELQIARLPARDSTRQHATTNSFPLCLTWQTDLDAPACCLQNIPPGQLHPPIASQDHSSWIPPQARASVELPHRLHVKIDFPRQEPRFESEATTHHTQRNLCAPTATSTPLPHPG